MSELPSDIDADILARLSKTLAGRKSAAPENSYSARLLAKGEEAILKKIGEDRRPSSSRPPTCSFTF